MADKGLPVEEEENAEEHEVQYQGIPEDLADVAFVVEGRELKVNRAVLACLSPVFHKMFFSNFKEKGEKRIPLPEEKYQDMVTFLNLLCPRTPTSEELISDENLLQLLTLADKYNTEEVKARCQDFIGTQLASHYRHFFERITTATSMNVLCNGRLQSSTAINLPVPKGTVQGQKLEKGDILNKLSLYIRSCDQYGLPKHREEVKALILAMCKGLKDLSGTDHYTLLPEATRIELLECLCRRLD